MKLSEKGYDLLLRLEGGFKTDVYLDAVGVKTVGAGCTSWSELKKLRVGDRVSIEQCKSLFKWDIAQHEKPMSLIGIDRLLSSNQWDAAVIFFFNVGYVGANKQYNRLDLGDLRAFELMLDSYIYGTVKGKKQIIDGLVKRRAIEQYLFRSKTEAQIEYAYRLNYEDVSLSTTDNNKKMGMVRGLGASYGRMVE